MRLLSACLAAALLGTAAPASAAITTVFTFVTDPFKDSDARTTPGRQIVGDERVITFDIATAAFGFDAVAYGVSHLHFVNAPAAGLPASGVNVVVLRTLDDDGDPVTPFGAGEAADLIAAAIEDSRAGFFVYFDSALDLPRLVFSTDLGVGTADLKILAAMSDLVGMPDVLSDFRPENFRILGDVVEVPEPSGFLLLGAGALLAGASLRQRRRMV